MCRRLSSILGNMAPFVNLRLRSFALSAAIEMPEVPGIELMGRNYVWPWIVGYFRAVLVLRSRMETYIRRLIRRATPFVLFRCQSLGSKCCVGIGRSSANPPSRVSCSPGPCDESRTSAEGGTERGQERPHLLFRRRGGYQKKETFDILIGLS